MSRLKVHDKNQIYTFEIEDGDGRSLLEILKSQGILLPAECGGCGKCGSCQVTLLYEDGQERIRSCCRRVEGDMEILLPETEREEAQPLPQKTSPDGPKSPLPAFTESRRGIGCAVDLGTTSIALKLFDLERGQELGGCSFWNPQIPFGADVISRIDYINRNEKGLETLSELVWKEIAENCDSLLQEKGRSADEILEIVISGNTVMEHIAAGKNPASIAAFPFQPETLFDGEDGEVRNEKQRITDRFGEAVKILFMPCVSGYVGGDILSGMYAREIFQSREPVFFIDLGTNGEMAIGEKGRFLSVSVATGPAFEGSEISCGMRAKKGAVSHVFRQADGRLGLEIIGGQRARGICGSGLIDLLAILREEGIIDSNGRCEEDFFLTENRKVCLTPKDVRKLQLAKAAAAAGMEILLNDSGYSAEGISKVYIAGSFGEHLNAENAAKIGLVLPVLKEKVEFAGNTSLDGAVKLLLRPADMEILRRAKETVGYEELSTRKDFNDYFIKNMTF